MKRESLQLQWQWVVGVPLLALSSLLTLHFFTSGFASRDIPNPTDYSAILVDEKSPRNQASVWISTPQMTNIRVDPTQLITLQFYASLETSDPGVEPMTKDSDAMLRDYSISYLLVDRLARHLVACDNATIESLTFSDLNASQLDMAGRALPISQLTESGPNPQEEGPVSTDEWQIVSVAPRTAAAQSWRSPLGDQPTAVTDFTCTFEPEAFWLRGDGALVLSLPGLYGNLEAGAAAPGDGRQLLTRRIVLARPSPEPDYEFSDGDVKPETDSNRNSRYESLAQGGTRASVESALVWYLDTRFDENKARDVFIAGALVSVVASILLDLVGLGRQSLVDRCADRRMGASSSAPSAEGGDS